MKYFRIISICSCLIVISIFLTLVQIPLAFCSPEQNLPAEQMPFWVYKDAKSPENHYVPSGWMGDYGDIEMNLDYQDNPFEGKSCIKFSYSARQSQDEGWAGVYFQHPTNNWGMLQGGYNLSGARRLVFYARGDTGGEIINEFKVGGINGGEFMDTDVASLTDVRLTKEWKQYIIDLQGLDLSRIIGGFCWSTGKEDNPGGIIFYIDGIHYE